MKEFSIKNIFQFNFLIFILSQIKCEENFTKNKRDTDKSDINPHPEPEPQPDMIEVLEELKEDIQNISKEIAQYDTLIYILIPFATLLFLIFGAFILYEIIKCCKKKESELNGETKNSSFVRSDNNNLSKSKNSLTDSSSLRNDKNVLNEEISKNNTLMIMIIVNIVLTVITFLIIFFCLCRAKRRANQNENFGFGLVDKSEK